MTRKHESPSKRWFWWTVAVGNVYLAIGFILPLFWNPEGLLLDALMVFFFPGQVMLVLFVEPTVTLLTRVRLVSDHAGDLGAVVATVALSEIGVLLVGLLVYRAARLLAGRRANSGHRQDSADG